MSDEDFEPFVGGPPPDPSERTWRHPSELAAQANADAMAAKRGGPARSRLDVWVGSRSRSLTVLLAGSLGAAACLTALAALSTGGDDGAPLGSGGIDAAGVVDVVSPDADRSAPDPATTIAIEPGALSSTTSSPPTTLSSSLDTAAVNPAVADASDHHLVSVITDSEHVASAVVIGGYVLTSASAVGDRLSITISNGRGDPALAYLVGTDPFSDLAVYRPSIRVRAATVWSAISLRTVDTGDTTSITQASDETPPAVAGTAVRPGDAVFLASATSGGTTVDTGIVIDTDCEGEAPNGQTLVGLIDTSVRRPVDGAGSLLLSGNGSPVGIVVESTSSLASAVPIGEALLIAEGLVERGWANQTWIGFIGMDVADGVEVVDVADAGPARAAGLRPGDVIAFLDGSPIEHMGGITAGLRRAAPGDAVVMVIERDGEFVSVRVIAEAYGVPERVTEPIGG